MPKTARSPGSVALGNEILRLRTAKNLTQTQLADLVETVQATIAKIEKGIRGVDSVEVVVLARALSVDPESLIAVVNGSTPANQTFR